jgi:hypothetical protein
LEYLSPDDLRSCSAACRAQLEALLATKAVVGKPHARQWKFLKDAVEHLLTGNHSSEFAGVSPVQAAQLKFEVEDKLRRFYLRPGRSPQFVFMLVHHSELGLYGLEDGAYPALAGSGNPSLDHLLCPPKALDFPSIRETLPLSLAVSTTRGGGRKFSKTRQRYEFSKLAAS